MEIKPIVNELSQRNHCANNHNTEAQHQGRTVEIVNGEAQLNKK